MSDRIKELRAAYESARDAYAAAYDADIVGDYAAHTTFAAYAAAYAAAADAADAAKAALEAAEREMTN